MLKKNGLKGSARKPRSKKSKHIQERTARTKLVKLDSLPEIIQNHKNMDDYRKYNWQLFAELASQRNKIQDEIRAAIIAKSGTFAANGYQRAVKYKYGLHPLSIIGSLVDIGGRFNIGQQVNQEFAAFPALYVAQDKDTALQEHLGQESAIKSGLSPREIALTAPQSEVIVSVSINLNKSLDITNINNLTPFINLIRDFKLSKEVKELAKKLKIPSATMISSVRALRNSLLEHDWRRVSRLYDLPSNSQIFGQLLYLAGIEGIIYTSKFTRKKCIAIFPRNLIDVNSYIVIDDQPPHPNVPTRIDGSNWHLTELSYKEIV